MLVLTRKSQERIHIGDNVTITVVRIKGNTVRVGIEAPDQVRVVRGEIAATAPEKAQTQDKSRVSEATNGAEEESPGGLRAQVMARRRQQTRPRRTQIDLGDANELSAHAV